MLQATIAGLFEEGRQLQAGEVLTVTGGEAQAVSYSLMTRRQSPRWTAPNRSYSRARPASGSGT